MAPEFKTSFIPKDPSIGRDVFQKKKRSFFGNLIFLILILSIISAVGLNAYKLVLANQISNLETSLTQAYADIDKESLNEMSNFSKKVKVS